VKKLEKVAFLSRLVEISLNYEEYTPLIPEKRDENVLSFVTNNISASMAND